MYDLLSAYPCVLFYRLSIIKHCMMQAFNKHLWILCSKGHNNVPINWLSTIMTYLHNILKNLVKEQIVIVLYFSLSPPLSLSIYLYIYLIIYLPCSLPHSFTLVNAVMVRFAIAPPSNIMLTIWLSHTSLSHSYTHEPYLNKMIHVF